MQIYGPSRIDGPHSLQGPHAPRSTSAPARTQGADEVSISAAADAAVGSTDGVIRADLVARVRDQIAAGTYENAEKLDAAIERMLDEMG